MSLLNLKILADERRDERVALIGLSAVCFILHIWGINRLYSPFLYYEEMGYWANAAFLRGYNWSNVIIASGMPWYCYGYSLTLLPLFWIFNSITPMYRAAIVLNGIWSVLSFLLCYAIAKYFGTNLEKKYLLASSFVVSIYSPYLHQSSIAVVETFLYFLVWLLFWLFLRFEEDDSIINGIELGLSASVMYISHNRTVGICFALALTLIAMTVLRKTTLRHAMSVMIPMAGILILHIFMKKYMMMNIWGGTISTNGYRDNINGLLGVFSNSVRFARILASFLGKIWYAVAASFMLFLYGVTLGVWNIRLQIKSRSKGLFTLSFYMLSLLASLAVSTITTSKMATYRVDSIIYGRYAECSVGVFILFGLMGLLQLSQIPRKIKIAYGVSSLFFFVILSFAIQAYYTYIIRINGPMSAMPDTQVNSTPGIFFYHLLGGQFTVYKCTFIAGTVSVITFLTFSVARRGALRHVAVVLSLGLISVLFLYTAGEATNKYTYPNQSANSDTVFLDLVRAVDTSLTGKNIFLQSSNLYEYLDYQNHIIHNSIIVDDSEMLFSGDIDCDYAIVHVSDLGRLSESNQFRIAYFNQTYAVLYNRDSGDETSYQTLLNYGRTRFLDISQFSTDVGFLSDGKLVSNGQAGYMLYGQKRFLPRGDYTITLSGTLQAGTLDENSFFTLRYNEGMNNVLKIFNLNDYVWNDTFKLTADCTLGQSSQDYELCLYLNSNVQLEISSVCLTLQSDELKLDEITEITFDFGENENFAFSGFSNNETTYRWTSENDSVIYTGNSLKRKDYLCQVSMGNNRPWPLERGLTDAYEIRIRINNSVESEQSILLTKEKRSFTFIVDDSFLNETENTFSLSAPIWSPADFGSGDTRGLGFAIDKIVFRPADSFEEIVCDLGEYENFSFDGFAGNETSFRWTNSETATITPIFLWWDGNYMCHASILPYNPPALFQDGVYPITVTINGNLESETVISLYPGETQFVFPVESKYLANTNTIAFRSELWSPLNYGSPDNRELGFALDKLTFELLR